MKKQRESYFMNFSTSSLFTILEEREKELETIDNNKEHFLKKELQKKRKKELEFIIKVIKELLVSRFMQEDLKINECCKFVLKEKGVKKEVFKDILVYKILNNNDLVDIFVLNQAIKELELHHLQAIICSKPNTIYSNIANKCFDDIIFNVRDDVYEELVKKIKMDRKEV